MSEGFNLAVLVGRLSSDPRTLDLASGSRLLRLELTTPGTAGGRAESVPVAWFDPPASASPLGSGDAVLVVGRVRRRWWAGSGSSRSATEVLATTVEPVRRRARARRAVAAAAADVEAVLAR